VTQNDSGSIIHRVEYGGAMTEISGFTPLSEILRDRRLGAVIGGTAVSQLVLTLFGLPSWPCPVFHALGIPCPGCGLTRASLFLVNGQWKDAITMHAFAPIFLFGLLLIMICTVGPREPRTRIVQGTEILERHTGITTILLAGLILYWLARLLLLQTAFVRLIQG
jgi:hypothetical protein